MKRKIVSLVLMAVAITAVTMTVVSCKDSDFEYLMQQQLDENSTLTDAMKAQIAALEEMLQTVQSEQTTMQNTITSLQKVVDDNSKAIEDNQAAIDAATEAIKENADAINANSELIDQQGKAIDANSATIEEHTKQIEENAQAIADAITDIATAMSAIDVLDDAMQEINDALTANGFEDMNAMVAEVVGIMNSYVYLKGLIDQNAEDIGDLQDGLTELENKVVEFGNTLDEHSKTIDQLLTDTKETAELAQANEKRITILETSLGELSDDLEVVKENLKAAQDDIAKINEGLSTAQGDISDIKARLTIVETGLGEAQDNITDLQNDLLDVQKELLEVQQDVADLKQQAIDNLQAAEDYADSLIAALKGDDFTYDTLGEFQAAVEQALQEIDDDITALTERIEQTDDAVNKLVEQVNDLLDLTDYIMDYLSQQVTSILVQATVNPVFGTFALPMNVTSNVLAAYYGSIDDSDASFPTARKGFYANTTDGPFLTSEDLQMLGMSEKELEVNSDGYLLLDKEGNAGTLYVTVNPNTVDFDGLKFGMENSIQEASGVELGGLEKSDYKLSFGYTRADVSNGFYEASATVPSGSIAREVSPRIDINELKEVVTDLTDYIKSGSGLDVSGVLTTLYQQFTDVLDANAVYAEWTDKEDVAHRTYSQYSIAATAVHPLSYAFMVDTDYETFPGINRIENVINSLFEKIDIPTFDLSQYHLSEIKPVEYDETYIYFDAKIQVSTEGLTPGETVYIYGIGENGEQVVIGEGTWDGNGSTMDIWITLELRKDEIYAEPIDDINDVIDSINNALDDINSILDDLERINNIAGGLQDVQDQLISYVDRLNEQLCKMINSVNTTLQPIILVYTTNGFTKISQMRSSPTLLSSGDNITLLPTSFTAEILAPAYQKLVGVTNVYSLSDLNVNAQSGDATCLSLLNTANSSSNEMAKVIDGDTRQVSISGLKAGYIYEIAYTAVDYSGKVAAQKCYVRVAQ